MEELQGIVSKNPNELLSSLDSYQTEIINSFLKQNSNDYLDSADKWLNASTTNTAKFGGDLNKSKLYREKVLDELEKFLCGDESYSEDREKLKGSTDKSTKYIIGVLSAAIGKTLGTAGTFIAPIIVLLLISINKMLINAWCALRKEQKEHSSQQRL